MLNARLQSVRANNNDSPWNESVVSDLGPDGRCVLKCSEAAAQKLHSNAPPVQGPRPMPLDLKLSAT